MNPSFSVYTNYVTPTPFVVPSPNSQPNRKNQTHDTHEAARTKVHQADDLHDQLEGTADPSTDVDRPYSNDYFHGIPVSSFFVHPLAKNPESHSTERLISGESYGTDKQTPVSSIPALNQDQHDKNGISDNLNRPNPCDLPTDESMATRDHAFSVNLKANKTFEWPKIVRKLATDPHGAIEKLCRTTVNLLGQNENRIGITSTRIGEGCSTIAMSVALWAANNHRSVLLVDGDPNQPYLAEQLGASTGHSWITSLNDPHSIKDAVLQLPEVSVDLLPLNTTGSHVQWPARLFDRLGNMLKTVSRQYDLILIDIGPVFQLMTELEMSIHLMDTAILTAAVNQTTIQERTQSQKRLTSLGVQKMVVAENFSQLAHHEPALIG